MNLRDGDASESMETRTSTVVSVDPPRPGIVVWLLLRPIFSPVRRTLDLLLGPMVDLAARRSQDEGPVFSEKTPLLRGRHILTTSKDGALRCVACSLCRAACPSQCIRIEAKEALAKEGVIGERRPRIFEIDLLRCIFCGSCVDACPEGAILMSGDRENVFTDRLAAVAGIQDLRRERERADGDPGHR